MTTSFAAGSWSAVTIRDARLGPLQQALLDLGCARICVNALR